MPEWGVGDAAVFTGGIKVRLVSADPSAGAGVDEEIGTLALRTDTGQVWQKVGSADTAWERKAPQDDRFDGDSGFPNRTDTTLSYTLGTRTFTLTPTGSTFDVYVAGEKVTLTGAQERIWTDDEGVHYFYITSAGTLTSSQTFPDLATNTITATLYYDKTTPEVSYFADERHGVAMPSTVHEYLHKTRGTVYEEGLAPSLTTDQNGSSDSHAQMAISEGIIWDEDLEHEVLDSVQDITPTLNAPVFYRSGTVWRRKSANTFPFVYAGEAGYAGTRLPYNSVALGVWGWTEVGNADYVLIHLFATNDTTWPVISVHGQASYATTKLAREGARTELQNLYTEGLPFAEMLPICTVILQTNSGYGNTPKARTVSTDDGEDFVDWRGGKLVPGGGVSASDHGTLTGLTDNDHPQYGLLASDQAWTALNYATQTELINDAGEINIVGGTDTNSTYYDLADGDAQLMAPGLPAGARFSLLVEADGAHELTYEGGGGIFDFGSETAPDFSAMADGTLVLLDFYVVTIGSRILSAASVRY